MKKQDQEEIDELLKPRNPLYDHPLMKKGGRHEKTSRAREKRKLRKQFKNEY